MSMAVQQRRAGIHNVECWGSLDCGLLRPRSAMLLISAVRKQNGNWYLEVFGIVLQYTIYRSITIQNMLYY